MCSGERGGRDHDRDRRFLRVDFRSRTAHRTARPTCIFFAAQAELMSSDIMTAARPEHGHAVVDDVVPTASWKAVASSITGPHSSGKEGNFPVAKSAVAASSRLISRAILTMVRFEAVPMGQHDSGRRLPACRR